MKKIIIMLLLCNVTKLYTQAQSDTKLTLMQGIWECTLNDETNNTFKIVKGRNCLEFSFSNESEDLEFSLFDMIIGFQNVVSKYNDIQLINVDSLKENGLYYTEIIDRKDIENDGTIDKAFCVIPSYYECDGKNLSINGGKLFEYEKIFKLPKKALEKLYYRGKHDKRDYIKDYLDIKVAKINSDKSIVYSNPNIIKIIELNKDDIITVLEEKENWLKIEYGADNLGWINKNDIK